MTTPDIGKARSDFAAAQAALSQAHAASAAVAKEAADARHAREVEWSWSTIVAYQGRLADASDRVTTALAAFRAAVAQDLNAAAAKYVEIAARMGEANRLGEDLSKARGILRSASLLPPGRANRPEMTGASAPFPFVGGPSALPDFLSLVASELEVARAAAIRVPSSEDPGSFTGQATEAMKRAVLADEFTLNDEMELMLGLRAQHPAHFAERIPADQQAQVSAYASCREARGYDGPLPKAGIPVAWRQPEGFPTARDAAERWTLNR